MGKATKVLSVIAIILAVVIGGSFLSYAFIAPVRNTIDNIALSPDRLYSKVNSKYTNTTAKSASELYKKVSNIANGENEQGYNTSLKATLGDKLISQLGVSDVKSVALNASFGSKDKKSSQNISVDYDNKKLVTLNISEDSDTKMAYIQVPELSDSFLSLKEDELAPYLESKGLSLSSITNQLNLPLNQAEIKPNGDVSFSMTDSEIVDIISRYSNIILNPKSTVSRQNNVTGDIDGAGYSYTKLSYDITYEDFFNIINNVLNEAKNDKALKKLIVDTGILKDTDYDTQIQSAIDSLQNEKDKPSFYGYTGDESSFNVKNTYLTLNTYIDSNKVVCGREIISKEKDSEISCGYILIDNDKNYAINAWGKTDGKELFAVKGNLTKDGNKMNGSIVESFDIEGKTVSAKADFKDYEIVNKDKNLVNGTVTVTSEENGQKCQVIMTCKVDNKKQSINMVVNLDSEMLFTLDVSYEETQVADIKLPASGTKVYNALKDTEMQEYLAKVDIEGFSKKLTDSLGTDFVNGLMSKGTSGLGGLNSNSDSSTQSNENLYDFSKISYTLNGKGTAFPFSASEITGLVKYSKTTLDADGYDYGYNDDYSISVRAINLTKSSLPIEQCSIEKLDIDKTSSDKINLTVNGIKIGSTYDEVISAFGIKNNTDKNSISISDTKNSSNNIYFSFIDGKVYSISVDFFS